MAIAPVSWAREPEEDLAARLAPRRQVLVLIGLAILWLAAIGGVLALRNATWTLHPREFDLITALPVTYWSCLVLGSIVGTLTLWQASRPWIITACVSGVSFLSSPGFLVGLYPALAGWDSYLHTSPARGLLLGSGVPRSNFYASQYPGAPALLALVAGMTGWSPLQVELVATVVAQLALVLIFMGLARIFLDLKASAWAALAVLALTPEITTNDHFAPFLLGLLAMWTVVLLLASSLQSGPLEWVGVSLCAIILAAAVVVSHPFLPIITGGLVAGLACWSWLKRSSRTESIWWFLAALAVGMSAWMVYEAAIYFKQGIATIAAILTDQQSQAASNLTAIPLTEVLRRSTPAALGLIGLRVGLYVAAGTLALAGLLSRTRRSQTALWLWLAALSGAASFAGFASRQAWIQRLLYMAPPLLVLAAGIALCAGAGWIGAGRRLQLTAVAGIAGALLLSVVLWHPPTLIYSLHPEESAFVTWPQEAAAARYVAHHAARRDTIGSDIETLIMYSYFQPSYAAFNHGLGYSTSFPGQLKKNPLLFDGDWIIRSRRQALMGYSVQDLRAGFWKTVDHRLQTRLDRLYTNGFSQVYHRRVN